MPMPTRNPYETSSSVEDQHYDSRTRSESVVSGHYPLRRQHTTSMSYENTELTEIITIYEKLKSRQTEVFRVSQFRPMTSIDVELKHIVEETVPIQPFFTFTNSLDGSVINEDGEGTNDGGGGGQIPQTVGCSILDFNKYQHLDLKKYLYFSTDTNLLLSDNLKGLSQDYVKLLSSKNYWLNIINPSELDLGILFQYFNVHDLTISDIRECGTAEKIEIFKHYTFISMRLFGEAGYGDTLTMVSDDKSQLPDKDPSPSEDVDFNILIFKDFVITMHDKQWASIKDILGFLNLLASAANTVLTPDWVLFSVFIELQQDAQCMLDTIEPEINKIRSGSKSLNEMGDIMRRNFDMEFQIYKISRFLKPKMNILRMLKNKCGKRLSKVVVVLLSDILDDFREISHDLSHFNHILERSQDTFLALVNVEESRQSNELSIMMKRISEIAVIFLPIQAVAGFLGMNVKVPFQAGDVYDTTVPFWSVVGMCICVSLIIFCLKSRLSGATTKKTLRLRRPSFLGRMESDI